MSLEVDLGEFLTAYLAEAEEHVNAANSRLLTIERAVEAGGADPRAVRDLFRTLHTLKGLSAMVGVEPIVAIAHAMESIVRGADRTGATLPAETLESLFGGLRAIEERLAAVSRGDTAAPAPAAVLERLETTPRPSARGRAAPSATLELEPALRAKLAPFEEQLLLTASAQGKRALRAEFAPSPARAAQGLTITTVRERLAAIADIVKVAPVATPIAEDAPGGLRFVILLVTHADDAAIAEAIGGAADGVKPLLATSEEPAPESFASHYPGDDIDAGEGARRAVGRGMLRVDVARVDDALERLSALLVTRARLARSVAELGRTGAQTRELQVIVQETTRQLRDMRAAILGLRMVPFADVLARLPLVLRGLSRASGKEVRLVTETNDAELDKSVAERVFPVLVHLLRNAVDHGIEAAAERLRASKPPYGTVRVSCTMASNRQLVIRVADDGGGIDHEALARTVGHSIEPTGAAILEVLCRPGVSTRREATATSGRGMGMDIVRKIVVEQLGGEVALETTRGAGTIFSLQIPVTVAVLDAFTVSCEGETFAVPISSVEEIVEIDPASVVTTSFGGRRVSLFERRGEAVTLVHLFDALGRERSGSARDGARHGVVVRRAGEPVAFLLDRVVGQQETVVRPLVDPLVQAPGLAGCADLGDGRATLVLDLVALASKHGERTRHEPPPVKELAP